MDHDCMMMHGRAYSSRKGVIVILPGAGPDGCGNHFYPRASGATVVYVHRCITDALRTEARIAQRHERMAAECFMTPRNEVMPGPDGRGIVWARRPFTVSVRPDAVERGTYSFTVWAASA